MKNLPLTLTFLTASLFGSLTYAQSAPMTSVDGEQYVVVLQYPEWRCQDISGQRKSRWFALPNNSTSARTFNGNCREWGQVASTFQDSKAYPGYICADIKNQNNHSFWYLKSKGMKSGKLYTGNCKKWGDNEGRRLYPTISESHSSLRPLVDKLNCDQTKFTNEGILCALRPSTTDYRISDGLNKKGFGHHVIGIPLSLSKASRPHVHFTGAYGKPYVERQNEFGTELLLRDGMAKGRLMVQLAYDNEESVNEMCNKYGSKINNCAGKIRQNKLDGSQPFSLSDTASTDSILFRLSRAVGYLKNKGTLSKSHRFSLANYGMSGHSQGGGHALFISKKNTVKSVCLLAGGYDSPDQIALRGEKMADWIKLPGVTKTSKISAIVHKRDDSYRPFSELYKYFNLYQNGQAKDVTSTRLTNKDGERITNYHGSVIGARELSSLRKGVCFAD